MDKKMADIDINPFGEHELRPEEPTDKNIPLDPVTPVRGGVQTWEPTHEQEMSFGGREPQRTKLMKDYIKDLYKNYQKTLVKPQNYFTVINSNLKMESCTTEAIEIP